MLSMGNYSETEIHGSASTYLSLNESIPARDSIYVVIPITVIYFLILICGVFGNVITCIVICRNRGMHTATNFYLLSLSVSDMLLLVTGLPPEIYSVWSHYPYIFGEEFCILRGLAAETSANATVLTITAFTVERYVAICHPFLSHTLSKLSRAVRLIILIWIIAFAFAIPSAAHFGVIALNHPDYTICAIKRVIFRHYFELLTFLFFVMPMTLITVFYVLIAIRLRQSNKLEVVQGHHRISSDGSESSRRESRGQNNVGRHTSGKSSRRVIKMLVVVVAAFFICWAPFHAQRLVAMHVTSMDDSPDIYSIVTYISGVLYYISTAINPLLYNIMSHKFREAFKDMASNCYGCLSRRQDEYSILAKASRREKCEAYCSRRDHRKGLSPSSSRRLTLTNRRPDETSSSFIITIPMQLIKSSNSQTRVIREYQAWLEEWHDGGPVRVAEEALGRVGRSRNVMMMLTAAAVSVVIAGAGRADTAGTICGKLGDLVWARRNRVIELRETNMFRGRRGSLQKIEDKKSEREVISPMIDE